MIKPELNSAIDRIRQLPTLPSVLGRILGAAADPATSALELGQLIASDQSLSVTILRLVNSAYYGFHREIDTISQAVVILGFFKVRNLTLTASAFHHFRGRACDFDRTQLWRHALASGMAAEYVARKAGGDLTGSYEAGLLHDIGKVALDTLFPELFARAVQKAQQEGRFVHETVLETIGLDPMEAGGLLAERWGLPSAISQAIRFHLEPEKATENPRLAAITALAVFCTYPAGFGEASNGRDLPFPEKASELLGISREECAFVAETLAEHRDKIDDLLGALNES